MDRDIMTQASVSDRRAAYTDQEILDELAAVQRAGFGELIIRVHEHHAVEVLTTLRKRKPAPMPKTR
jgi:hypothetical protein